MVEINFYLSNGHSYATHMSTRKKALGEYLQTREYSHSLFASLASPLKTVWRMLASLASPRKMFWQMSASRASLASA
jgi:hypothetical protein